MMTLKKLNLSRWHFYICW